MKLKAIIMGLGILLFASTLFSQSIEGTWITIDDETNAKKSEIQIWKEGNVFKGKIIKIYDPAKQNSVCEKCDADDPRYKKKVIGMVILDKLVLDEKNFWDDGEILDPANGSVYDCNVTLMPNGDIQLRGYVGISLIGRTQTWKRAK